MSAIAKLEEIRQAAAKARKFRDIEWNGVKLRVVMPMLNTALALNDENGVLLAIKSCVTDPETGEKPFAELPLEQIGDECDDTLAKAVVDALGAMREAVEGNSESTPSVE